MVFWTKNRLSGFGEYRHPRIKVGVLRIKALGTGGVLDANYTSKGSGFPRVLFHLVRIVED